MNKKSLIALIALIVACVMVFAACGGGADKDEDKKDDETTVSTEDTTAAPEVDVPTEKTDAEKVADYVAANGNEIISAFESGFTSSGMTCTSTVEAVDTGIVLTICLNDLVDLTDDQKSAMQSTFDQLASSLGSGFGDVQNEIPELTYIKFDFCEKDGDLVATVTIDGSTADAPIVDAPVVDEPAGSAGEVTYAGFTSYNTLEGFTFNYDANGYVTSVVFEDVTNPDETASQSTIDILDKLYDAFEGYKNQGYNLTVDFATIDGVCNFEAVITLSSEKEVALVGELLMDSTISGATLTLEKAEAAAKAQGYTVFEG